LGRPDLTAAGLDPAPEPAVTWPALEIEIPETSPEAVAIPAFRTWESHARANRAALDGSDVRVGGAPLGDLRRQTRSDVVALAAEYTASLGLPVERASGDLVIATGHQPGFVHPGICLKYLAMARMLPADGVGVNLIVDNDATESISADVPHRSGGRVVRARAQLAAGGPDVPAEAIAAPTARQWEEFRAAIDKHVATLGEPEIEAAWSRARVLPPPPAHAGVAGALTVARRALEGRRAYIDLPMSWAMRVRGFRRLALAILRDAGRFAGMHNRLLASYREHYGLRTSAQPFPDLDAQGAVVEVPFWYVEGGRRRALAVNTESRRLLAGGTDVGPLPDDPDDPAWARAPVRPRAVTLSIFARLLASDFFIHGLGGGRYDRATDAITRAFFGVEPPAYAVATATLFLPFASGGPRIAERRRLHRLLMDLQHNPDRFLSNDGRSTGGPSADGPAAAGGHRALVDEKWTLIRALERADALTRRERRAATHRIREINVLLRPLVDARVAEVQDQLRLLDDHDAQAAATAYRGYPFLLFPAEAIDGLVDRLARDRSAE
jgi:hypothetical protein